MRCLRCALEYGPDEQYCHRCGRALSRPLGAKRSAGVEREGQRETAYMYSTHAPPAVGDVETTYRETAGAAVRPTSDEHKAAPVDAWHGDQLRDEEDDPLSAPDRTTLNGDAPDEEFDGIPREVLVPVNDDDFEESTSGEAPAVVERLDDTREQGLFYGTPHAATRIPSIARRLAVPLVIIVVLCVAGGFALSRHASFADNLSSARAFAAHGQYQAAIDAYQRAIKAWPLNDAAKAGMASAMASLASQQAAAAAAAQAAQVHAQAAAARGEMLQAKQRERQAAAQQFDASAPTAPAALGAPHTSSAAVLAGHGAAKAAAQKGPVDRGAVSRTAVAPAPAITSGPARLARLRAALVAGKPLVYAAIGASETVGVGADDPATQSWVADLARRLPPGSRLLNLGKSGALISYGVGTELPGAVAGNPDLITIWMAVNDLNALLAARPTPAALAQQVAATYAPQLTTLLRTLRLRTHAAIFVGNIPDLALEPAYRSQGLTEASLAPYITAFNRTIAAVVRKQGATLVDLYAPTRTTLPAHPDYVSGDGFHPSTRGYVSIAATWWQALRGVAQGGQ